MVALKEQEANVDGRFTRAHDYHSNLNENFVHEFEVLEVRVDRIEAALDQLRGAKNVLIFLFGANMLALVAFAYTLVSGT